MADDDDDDMAVSYWHHRLVEYVTDDGKVDCVMPHEFHYEKKADGTILYTGFATGGAIAMSKEEAQWILDCFSRPPAARVWESSRITDEFGFPDFTKFEWLVPHKKED